MHNPVKIPPADYLAQAVSVSIAQCIMMAISSKYVAATFPLLAVIFYLLQHFYLRTSRQLRLLEIEHKAPLDTQMTETLEGLPTIRAFGREKRAREKM